MPILIRDEHLEDQIKAEQARRSDGTMAKTLGDIARERLMELEIKRRNGGQTGADSQEKANPSVSGREPASSPAA